MPRPRANHRWIDGGTEARQHEREAALGLYLKNPYPATVLDMSTTGICVEGDHILIPLERRKFTLELGASRAHFEGEIRWCRLTSTQRVDSTSDVKPIYRSGIVFLEPVILA